MKIELVAKIVIPNLVILAMLWAVIQDDAGRLQYFRELGFTPSTAYYPFFYITSAVDGSTRIPGQLTLDWVQVLVVALIVIDLALLLPLLRRRTSAEPTPLASPAVA